MRTFYENYRNLKTGIHIIGGPALPRTKPSLGTKSGSDKVRVCTVWYSLVQLISWYKILWCSLVWFGTLSLKRENAATFTSFMKIEAPISEQFAFISFR